MDIQYSASGTTWKKSIYPAQLLKMGISEQIRQTASDCRHLHHLCCCSVSESAEWVCTKTVFHNGTVRRGCEKTYTGIIMKYFGQYFQRKKVDRLKGIDYSFATSQNNCEEPYSLNSTTAAFPQNFVNNHSFIRTLVQEARLSLCASGATRTVTL